MKDVARRRHSLDDDAGSPDLDIERGTRLEDMFDRYAGRVYAYAARRSTPDVAGDVVAETFLIAWSKLDTVPEESLPWLLGVARRVLANRRRSDERREAFTARRARELRDSPSLDSADAIATRMAIEQALDRLPPSEREALTLVAWDGLDVRSAAAASGCSPARLSVRLHRARRRLMKDLAMRRHGTAKAPSADNAA